MVAQLRAFLVALEEGSLNRAALRLRMSQSALSRQMQVLENEIGGALLERTAAGIRPTDAGYALATSLPRVLAEYDAAIEEARRLARGQRDLIRLGYLGSAAQTFLDPALSALRRTHPEVKVKLLDLSPGEQIVALRKGEIDLALIGQEGALLSNELYIRKLTTLPVVAVMPADHPLASRERISVKELRGERFISSPEEDLPGRDRCITQLCRRAGFRPKIRAASGQCFKPRINHCQRGNYNRWAASAVISIRNHADHDGASINPPSKLVSGRNHFFQPRPGEFSRSGCKSDPSSQSPNRFTGNHRNELFGNCRGISVLAAIRAVSDSGGNCRYLHRAGCTIRKLYPSNYHSLDLAFSRGRGAPGVAAIWNGFLAHRFDWNHSVDRDREEERDYDD